MDEMFRIMHFPDHKKALLDQLPDIPLILVSNFDHALTVRRALRKFGLEERFEAIFISDEVGWRKPRDDFFKLVLKETQYSPNSVSMLEMTRRRICMVPPARVFKSPG